MASSWTLSGSLVECNYDILGAMVTLCWQCDGQDCAADFALEAEARRCAELQRSRDNIRGVLLVDADGEPLDARCLRRNPRLVV